MFVVMDGLWSNLWDVLRVAYGEEADGEIGTFGTGALSGHGVSGENYDHEDINWEGTWFSRTNQYEWKHDT